MGVNLSDKRAETKTMTLKWGDDDVDVCYRPNAVTPALLESIEDAAKLDDLSALGVMLEPILEWWDVMDGDQRVPTTKESIREMPIRWIGIVQAGLEADQNPPADGNSAGS